MLQINEDRFNLFPYVMIFPFTCPHIFPFWFPWHSDWHSELGTLDKVHLGCHAAVSCSIETKNWTWCRKNRCTQHISAPQFLEAQTTVSQFWPTSPVLMKNLAIRCVLFVRKINHGRREEKNMKSQEQTVDNLERRTTQTYPDTVCWQDPIQLGK